MNREQVEQLSFEEALDRLTKLVEQLESGKLDLEASVAAFEEGVLLSRRCETLLEGAEQRLNLLTEQDEAAATPPRADGA